MGNKDNHFYLEKEYEHFLNNSKILNAKRGEKIMRRENFVLLAAFGFYNGIKVPVKTAKDHLDIFIMNQLEPEQLAILYAIAIADTGDTDIIVEDTKVAKITTEWANGGILALQELEENTQTGNELTKFQSVIEDAIKNI